VTGDDACGRVVAALAIDEASPAGPYGTRAK